MLEREREKGIKLARLSRVEKDEMVAQLMFGRHWKSAREAMHMLMQTWGLSPSDALATTELDHE
jgi:hypothetical protein